MAISHVAPLRFAPAFRTLGVCEHILLRYRNFECSNFIGPNQFIPLRHTMVAKLIRVRRIECSTNWTVPTKIDCQNYQQYLLKTMLLGIRCWIMEFTTMWSYIEPFIWHFPSTIKYIPILNALSVKKASFTTSISSGSSRAQALIALFNDLQWGSVRLGSNCLGLMELDLTVRSNFLDLILSKILRSNPFMI